MQNKQRRFWTHLECKYHPYAVLIEDSHAGDMVCSMCGLVVADRVIDVVFEWRAFSNDAKANDMCRVGSGKNFLLDGGDLSTMISSSSPSDSQQLDENGKPMYRNRRNISAPDRVLLSAFREISQMGEHLNLPESISDHADLLFKQVHEAKNLRACSNDVILNACLYMACHQEVLPRTFKELNI
ncbi:Transcription initiation factor IIB [Schistosoma japonicum]|uniref:General transcription factor TFIIB n=1 Tax=Schistosoma japonicum TaxID=6182 RepID=A0A4Z2DNS1_SCHJA|nr:Transcription initiation factor IIB [Schistosoma japonicum]